MNADRLLPVTALPLLLFWTLVAGSSTSEAIDGNYKSLAACVAEGKKQVEMGNARKADYETALAAYQRKGKTLATTEDYDVGWECIPSDGSARTYGGYWKAKANRPQP
jgi:hypothetical protein